jgi:monoamine oxidase
MGAGWAGTVDFQGQVIEAGGELIDTTHRTMRGYCQDFGLELEAYDQEPGDMFYHFQGQSWTEAEVVEELRALIPAMRRDLHRSSGAPTALSFTEADEELDNTDLATWLDSRGAGPLIRAAIEAAYIGEYGRELHEQTCLNLLLFMHPDRRSRFQPFGLWSDERYHVRQGSQAVARELAARLDGQIELDARLVALDRSPSGTYRLTFDDGQGSWEEQADRVVVALPFTVLREVDLGPGLELPAWKRVLIENYKLGHNSKMMIGFNGRPWQALGNDGATLSDLASTHNTWETNPSAATASRGVLTNYLGGDRALAVVGSAAEVQAAVADLQLLLPGIGAQLSTVSGLPRYHTQSWAPNPLSRGSYTCGGPGFFTTQAGLEAIPVGGLYFAGEHTDSFYNWQGYMEGAACSGVAAAAALLAG